MKKYKIALSLHKATIFFILCLGIILILNSCKPNILTEKHTSKNFKLDTLTWLDNIRNRKIPVAVFQPSNKKTVNKIPIIFSHGYGQNKGGDYLVYSYLTEFLAKQGYFVVSIQHELPTDELLAMEGKLQITRRPNWERGSENILFVLQKMKENFPDLKYGQLVLIGHSNGGDMTVLFAHQHPKLVDKIISLDNRRMELPRVLKPRIFTIRSNDYPADEGVIPNGEELKKYNITVDYSNINHSSMDDDANSEERNYLTSKIIEFLKD